MDGGVLSGASARAAHGLGRLVGGRAGGAAPVGAVRDVRLLKAMLVSKGWREGRSLRYLEAAGADHSECAWAARAPQMLEFLFPREKRL